MNTLVIRTGRALRGVVASLALVVSSLGALTMLTWSCCSTPSMEQKLGNPQLWAILAAAVTALAALPPVTRRLRAHRVRWVLLPFALADLAFCAWVGSFFAEGMTPRIDLSTGGRAPAQVLAPGEVEFTDLPFGVVTITATVDGARQEMQHDTANASAVLKVERRAPTTDAKR